MKDNLFKKVNQMIHKSMCIEDIANEIVKLNSALTREDAELLVKIQRARLDGTYIVAK